VQVQIVAAWPAKAGVNIEMISTSEIKISVVIDLTKGEQAMKAVHAAFLG